MISSNEAGIDSDRSDAITGLFARGWFRTALEAAFRLAQRGDAPVSVALLDIDGFKAVNDAHGHEVGDRLLTTVAGAVAAELSEPSFAGRYSGDELAFVLPDAAANAAFALCERVRAGVAASMAASVASAELPVGATVSIGVATYPEGASSPDELLHLADRALYRAKENGRDRVCAHEERDALTGLLNRFGITDLLRQALEGGTGQRPVAPVAIVAFDVDGFMQVNEQRGRSAGDNLLQHAARTLEGNFGDRVGGTVGRYAGDEFLVVLPGASANTAFILAEEVRRLIEATRLEIDAPPPLEVRLSAGVAAAPGDGSYEVELLRRADEALYRAKQEGRNRVALPAVTQMVTKTAHFTRTQLERLAQLAKRVGRSEAALLREGLDDVLRQYDAS